MEVIPILLICSLALVGGAVALFVYSTRQGDCTEADRICLMPLDDDDAKPESSTQKE